MEEIKKSTHKTEVVKVHLEPCPNADSLSLVTVFGYKVVVRTADWTEGALGAYVVPDSLVDTSKPEFAFLGGSNRIRVRRFRGTLSQGLLVKAPEGSKVGDDVSEILGVTRYQPPEPGEPGSPGYHPGRGMENERGPEGWSPKYDVDSWFRYKHLFKEGEEVVATEKVHGASARYAYRNGRMYCGSRTCWKKESDENIWWKALRKSPSIAEFCQAHDGMDTILYGEVYGQVQDLKYGHSKGGVSFVAFDVWQMGRWVGWEELGNLEKFQSLFWVPTIYKGPYEENKIRTLADGKSTVAKIHGDPNQLREGIVVKPIVERNDPEVGRVQLKLVSDTYLERAK